MSHIVTIETEVRDPAAVAAACRRLGLPEPAHGTARLFAGEATGLLVRLPGWLYPAVVDTRDRPGPLRQLRRALGRPGAPRPLPPGLRRREGHASRPASAATPSSSRPWPTARSG